MTQPASIPVNLTGPETLMGLGTASPLEAAPPPEPIIVVGHEPIVLIGPNGAGKSRFGVRIATEYGYTFVPADRQTTLPNALEQMMGGPALDSFMRQNQAGSREARSRTTSDVVALFQTLKAEEEQEAVGFMRDSVAQPGLAPPRSKLSRIESLWRVIFPDREFSLRTRNPKVRWTHADRATEQYAASEMSDGEKSVLYLAARLIYAPAGVVMIDEPEIHLHAMLARRFWSEVEADRPDCRFVYLTHDLQFALSRRSARIGIVKSPIKATLVPVGTDTPASLFQEIYGAASLSVVATRIVFCEGVDDGSLDRPFYEAWFRTPDTAVVPAGGCAAVREAVRVFNFNEAISNADAFGIVERDFWPDDWLAKRQAEGLFVLKVHELENLLCLEGVAQAVARHLRISDYSSRWAAVETDVRPRLKREFHIVERAKRRVDIGLEGLANAARTLPDRSSARAEFVDKIDLARLIPDAALLFDEEAAAVDAAADGSWDDLLKVFDGKKILGVVAQSVGMARQAYIDLVTSHLAEAEVTTAFGDELATVLQHHLPPRSA